MAFSLLNYIWETNIKIHYQSATRTILHNDKSLNCCVFMDSTVISVFPNSIYDSVGFNDDDNDEDLKTPTIENVLFWIRFQINAKLQLKIFKLSVLKLDKKAGVKKLPFSSPFIMVNNKNCNKKYIKFFVEHFI